MPNINQFNLSTTCGFFLIGKEGDVTGAKFGFRGFRGFWRRLEAVVAAHATRVATYWPQLWRQFAPYGSEVGCAKPVGAFGHPEVAHVRAPPPICEGNPSQMAREKGAEGSHFGADEKSANLCSQARAGPATFKATNNQTSQLLKNS